MSFLEALSAHAFVQRALTAGLLVALGCGLIGPLAVIHRSSLASGAIAHGLLVGVGIAVTWNWPPLYGALIAALIAALLTGWIHVRFRQQQDVLLAAVWSTGMALGILLFTSSPQGNTAISGFLFGSILLVSTAELQLMAALDGVLLLTVTLFYWQLVSSGLDEDYAHSRGIPINLCHLILLGSIACLTVLLIRVVGITLMIALIALPAATALAYVHSLRQAMALSVVIAALCITLGLAISFQLDQSPGATIVLLSVLLYVVTARRR